MPLLFGWTEHPVDGLGAPAQNTPLMPSNPSNLKAFGKDWVPGGLLRLVQSGLDYIRPAQWEYAKSGWETELYSSGWNVESVADAQKARWDRFAASLQGCGPLTLNHEDPAINSGLLRDHNTNITFAYVLAMAAQHKQAISILDWGGGIGHYCLLGHAVVPDITLDYYCCDLPLLCQVGREKVPQAKFFEDATACWARSYDLVLASSSLWYEHDWHDLVKKLVQSTKHYLFITKMVFIERLHSFVAIQRPWAVGYQTEYLCWVLNRAEFVDYVCSLNMSLIREFLICSGPRIHRAPEQGDYRGFLFRKGENNTSR